MDAEAKAQASSTNDQGDIVVTGSRIARRDYTANSPIVTVDNSFLSKNGSVAVESGLNKLPQFTAGLTAYSSHFTDSGQANLNLRGLGASRNLVLLDGRRLQPSNSQVAIDVNTIPSALIQSVEVISGGASAVYGSDAISGVVNFKLRQHLKGIELSGQNSITDRGDGRQTDLSIAIGSDFADGKGSFIAGFDYFDRAVFYSAARPFFAASFPVGGGLASSTLPYGLYMPSASNLPTQAAINSVFGGYGVAAGAVPRTALFGVNGDGSVFTQNAGGANYRGAIGSNGIGRNASNVLVYDPGFIQSLQSPLKRYSSFMRADYNVSDDVTVYAQGMYTSYTDITNGAGGNANGAQALTVPVTNPFIPADLARILASRPDPTAPFTVNKRASFTGERTIVHDVNVFQILVGATGKVHAIDGSWEIYASHGETDLDDTVTSGGLYHADLQRLIEAPDGGASICEGGFNVFADATPLSPACLTYLNHKIENRTTLSQDAVEANLQGKLFNLPAGELRFAVGGDYRRNSYGFSPDAAISGATTDVIGFTVAAPTNGSTSVYEGYAELLVPVLHNLPLVKELSLDLAYRYSHYPQTGNFSTYMANIDWQIVEGLRLRGGYQRAIRAPNVGELYQGALSGTANYGSVANGGGDPCDIRSTFRTTNPNAAQVRGLCLAQGVPSNAIDLYTTDFNTAIGLTGGNANVSAETANTYTAGVVLRPALGTPLLSHISASLDFYSINIADAIGTVAGPTALYKCFNSDGSNPDYSNDNPFCQAVARLGSAGTIFTIDSSYMNVGGYRTSGFDATLDWKVDMADMGLGNSGSLTLNVFANYLRFFKTQALDTDPFQDYTNTVSTAVSYPKFKSTTTLTYALGGASIGGRWMHISSMDDSSRVTNPTNVRGGVPGYSSFDLFSTIDVSKRFTLRLGVDNIGDTWPLAIAGIPGSTDIGLYDPAGRRYYAGFTARF